jgi:hypothetical protein
MIELKKEIDLGELGIAEEASVTIIFDTCGSDDIEVSIDEIKITSDHEQYREFIECQVAEMDDDGEYYSDVMAELESGKTDRMVDFHEAYGRKPYGWEMEKW